MERSIVDGVNIRGHRILGEEGRDLRLVLDLQLAKLD